EKKKIKMALAEEAKWETYFIEESKNALALKAKIEATDKEIEQIIYKLYNLKEAEIKLIEQA
ncbi:MAG: hypothetical protein V4549_09280, partial [Bacteroidota bacterium]